MREFLKKCGKFSILICIVGAIFSLFGAGMAYYQDASGPVVAVVGIVICIFGIVLTYSFGENGRTKG